MTDPADMAGVATWDALPAVKAGQFADLSTGEIVSDDLRAGSQAWHRAAAGCNVVHLT